MIMDHAEFVQKINDIAAQMGSTTDKETKKNLMDEFFKVGMIMWNEHVAGEVEFADGSTETIDTFFI